MKAQMKHAASLLLLLVTLLAAGVAHAGPAPATATRPVARTSSPTESLLPGDGTPGPAAFTQDTPQMARGGNQTLVVWEDSRTNYTNTLDGAAPQGGQEAGQQLKDIYAARLDSAGQLVDQTPIVVAQAPWSQTRPQVAWNGQDWLVVWITERVAGTTTTTDLLAARVSPAGLVLDTPPLVVDNRDAYNAIRPTVASDGSTWLVAWMGQDADSGLNGARIAADGTVLDPGGVLLHTAAFPDIPTNPGLTFAGDEYLLVWTANNKIKGLRLSPALQAVGGVFQVAAGGNFATAATDGSGFLVTWKLAASVLAARVAHDGTVLDPSGIDLSGAHGGDPRPQAIWDGTQWIATWVTTLGTTYAARLSAGGTLLDPDGIVVAANTRLSTLAARAGGGAVLAWTDSRLGGLGSLDIFAAPVAGDGTVGAAGAISGGAPSQLRPDLAANGSGYLAVFVSTVSGETRIKGQRLALDGTAIDGEPFLIQGGSATLTRPRVAWNGTLYLVVWEDSSVARGFVPGAIFGKRVSAGGTVLDAAPIDIMGGNTPDVAALGATFLVVDTYEQTNHIRFPMAVRVDGGGAVLGSPASIGQNYAVLPKVAALGSRWLAVWQRSPTHDNPATFIHAAFVNTDGTGAGSFLVAGVAVGRNVKAPDVAAGPTQALITYFHTASDFQENGDIYARRISADGTLLDSDPGIAVTAAPQAQFLSAAAWDGSEYMVAYEDYRAVPFLDRPVSDVYATRVDGNGTVLDPNGVAVANAAVPEVNAVVAANSGSYLIGTANFQDLAPYGAYRINVQYGQAGAPPTPAPTHTATPPVPSSTPVPATHTPAPPTGTPPPGSSATATPVPATASPTPTVCAISFVDVQPGSTFYPYVQTLACRGIVGGYPCGGPGEPCPGSYFRPNNNVTRGQAAKIISEAAGFQDVIPSTRQTFEDIAPGSTFWVWVERLAGRGVIGGYPCGGPGEPCGPPTNRPYFRPGNNVTRGQITKIVSGAAGWTETPTSQTFTDVAPGTTFYLYVERVASRGIISGYPCGGAGEPCVAPANRPYFRPSNPATRGQMAKIATAGFFPSGQVAGPR